MTENASPDEDLETELDADDEFEVVEYWPLWVHLVVALLLSGAFYLYGGWVSALVVFVLWFGTDVIRAWWRRRRERRSALQRAVST